MADMLSQSEKQIFGTIYPQTSAMSMFKCLNGLAPSYLANDCVPVSSGFFINLDCSEIFWDEWFLTSVFFLLSVMVPSNTTGYCPVLGTCKYFMSYHIDLLH